MLPTCYGNGRRLSNKKNGNCGPLQSRSIRLVLIPTEINLRIDVFIRISSNKRDIFCFYVRTNKWAWFRLL